MARAIEWPNGAGVEGALDGLPGLAGQGTLLDRVIYRPSTRMAGTPGDRGLDYEEVRFASADGTPLHGWFIPGFSPWVWLWFHGSAGNISTRLEGIKLAHHRLGASIFIFDYRGYGRSGGQVTEDGLYMDAEAAYLQLMQRGVSPKRLLLYGKSLGGAVAIHLAARRPAGALLAEATFTCIRDMARKSRVLRWFPCEKLLPSYDSITKIKDVHIPVLVIHGERDALVPPSYGQQLYIAANAPKDFYLVPRAHHSDSCTVGGTAYHRRLAEFLERLGRGSERPSPRITLNGVSLTQVGSRFARWTRKSRRHVEM